MLFRSVLEFFQVTIFEHYISAQNILRASMEFIKLGYVDAERFIMLVSREPFDYTEWRQEHLQDNMSIRELSNIAMKSVEQ